jgi:hypothetical protein
VDELSAVRQLLAEPPPQPDVIESARLRLERAALGGTSRRARVTLGRTSLRTRGARRGWHASPLARRAGSPRRWPGWVAPVAAAAAVAGVILASLAVSGLILRPAGTGVAGSSRALAKVPRYFVAIPEVSGIPAVVGATATGAVRGTVAPPAPHTFFAWVAAAGDGRTFVLGTSPRLRRGDYLDQPRPVTLYRLVLGRSGHPGRLAPLPIPPQTGITGLAVSPDGSKLAVSFIPAHGQTGSKIEIFSLATGARREWVWPGRGTLGEVAMPVASGGLSLHGGLRWEADNRTLMFEVTTRARNGNEPKQLYLLDTAALGGSLLAASTRIPVPSTDLGWLHYNAKHRITGMPLITGDGTKLVAPFYHQQAPPKVFGFTITEFSVRTGKPIRVFYQRRSRTEAASTAVYWVNTHGTAMIAVRGPVFGVQTPTTFTPLPRSTQRLFTRQTPVPGSLTRLPAW